ncbi:MAG: 2TM domain-containing protein [Thermomicrobiales bacterium]|nr:2TM domain-containing protein [Thermomicrobiales bacterium]
MKQEPQWSVKIERDHKRPRERSRYSRQPDRFRGFRVFVMSTFILHAMVFGIIMVMLFFINILTWDGFLWFPFPFLGWGSLVAMHGGVAWLTANAGVSRRAVEHAQSQPIMPNPKKDPDEAELFKIITGDLRKVDEMRAIARNMQTASARRNGLEAVNSIENTLIALEDQVEELPLARDFSGAFVEPAYRIFVEYDRLSRRDIQAAKSVLQEVERNDLPRITERAAQVHERVHRGTLIDLEVAREMLHLSETTHA